MKKSKALEIVNLLADSKDLAGNGFVIEEESFEEYLVGFHQWADNKNHLGSFLIRNKENNTALWFVFCEWNEKFGYYLIVFPENHIGPLIEIHKKGNQNLNWRYKPTKRDIYNQERKEYFTRFFGDVEVNIEIPTDNEEVSDFVDDMFQLTEVRIKSDELSKDLPAERDTFPEGKMVERKHKARERNSHVISLAKDKFKSKHGRLYCQVCGFDFEKIYGDIGKDFIEAHHTIPVSEMKPDHKTKLEDIAMLCSNCHRMVHKRRPWLTMSEMNNLLRY